MIIYLLLPVAAIAIIFYIAYIMISFKYTIPYVPTPRRVIKKMTKVAALEPEMKIIDIGSGTGRILFYIARRYRVQATGIEKFLFPYLVSRVKLISPARKGKVSFLKRDMQQFPLSDFDRVFCFLTPEGILPLAPKFAAELKKGAKIISYFFPIKELSGFTVKEVEHKRRRKTEKIYIYTKKP